MKRFMAAGMLLASCSLAFASQSQDPKRADEAFRAGVVATQAGDHDLAARHYRVALEYANAPRIRLELARSLLLNGEYAEAHRLFKDVYSEKTTPLSVRRNILPLMEEAELRIMRVRFGSRIVTDSNPARVSDGAAIYFNGQPLAYQSPYAKGIAYGFEPYLTAERLWDNGYLTSINLGARVFEEDDLNAGIVGVAVGGRFNAIGGIYVQARIDGEIRHKDESYALPSIDVWKRFELNERFRVGLGGQVGYMISENSDVSGGYYRPYAFADWSVSPNLLAFSRVALDHLNSKNDYYTYISPRVDVGVSFRVANWDITPQISVSYKRFSQFDEFWNITRRDVTVRPSIAFSNDLIEFRGIKPELNLFYEERDSNIELNSYDQFGGFINIRRAY